MPKVKPYKVIHLIDDTQRTQFLNKNQSYIRNHANGVQGMSSHPYRTLSMPSFDFDGYVGMADQFKRSTTEWKQCFFVHFPWEAGHTIKRNISWNAKYKIERSRQLAGKTEDHLDATWTWADKNAHMYVPERVCTLFCIHIGCPFSRSLNVFVHTSCK